MRISEAIRRVEIAFGYSTSIHDDWKQDEEAEKIAIEAMEKQEPMKPTYDHRYAELGCSVCGNMVSGWEEPANYCPNCGQSIDWREDE